MPTIKRAFIMLLCALLAVSPFAFAAYENVELYYNGELVEFEGAGAFYDGQHGCVMVPLRAFSEHIGASVHFDPDAGGIVITLYNTNITMAIGVNEAVVNGDRHITLPAPPVMEDDVSYVPAAAFSLSLNMEDVWDAQTMTLRLSMSRRYTLGVESEQIRYTFGIPERNDRSEQGFDWYVYNSVPGQLTMIGIHNTHVVAYYLYGGSWALDSGLYCGISLSSANFLMRAKEYVVLSGDSSVIYSNDEEYYVAYLDPDGERIVSVLYEDASFKDNFEINSRILTSFGMQICDLCNAYRTGLGEKALSPDPLLSGAAGKMAADMAEQNYFAHTDSHGQSTQDRLSDAGYSECYYAEALAEAYRNSFEAFSALIANTDYRTLAAADFDASGCAAAYNIDADGVLYYCQIFYAGIE